jgi:DNA polymerase III subunit epsilon
VGGPQGNEAGAELEAGAKRRRAKTSAQKVEAKPEKVSDRKSERAGVAKARATALVDAMAPALTVTEAVTETVTETVALVQPLAEPASVSSIQVAQVEPEVPLALELDSLQVVVFDVETTGTDRRNDQVIELGVQLGLGSAAQNRTWRFRPDVPIHPGAQAVHGISMADLEGCPSFRDCLDEIAALFEGAQVIIGYNIAFDIDMLQSEYERAGRRPLDFSGKTIVDAFRLWQQCEPRSLQHAHQRFVGDRFSAAHSASADVAATGRVLTGMLRAFGLEQQDWGAIAGLCDPQRATWIGPTRHLRWENGTVVLGFGKHAGSALHKIAHGPDRSFLRWVMDKDFPPHVVEICRAALELAARAPSEDAILEPMAAWARERFGPPPSANLNAPVVVMVAAASAVG